MPSVFCTNSAAWPGAWTSPREPGLPLVGCLERNMGINQVFLIWSSSYLYPAYARSSPNPNLPCHTYSLSRRQVLNNTTQYLHHILKALNCGVIWVLRPTFVKNSWRSDSAIFAEVDYDGDSLITPTLRSQESTGGGEDGRLSTYEPSRNLPREIVDKICRGSQSVIAEDKPCAEQPSPLTRVLQGGIMHMGGSQQSEAHTWN